MIVAASAVLLLLASAPARSEAGGGITVEPPLVKIGLFYGGQEVAVRAAVPEGSDVAVRVSGHGHDLTLKRKGKRGGILWMNVGEVTYAGVPSLFIVRSSRPLESMGSHEVLASLGLGYRALESRVVAPGDEPSRAHFGEMVELKEKERLFGVESGDVEFSSLGQGFQEASVSFVLPPKVLPGEYEVDVFAFHDGTGRLLGTGTLEVAFSPATAFLSNMARHHGLLYGCLAAVVAILAGLATGWLFGGKGGAH
jgi:hypothetical protein